MLGNMLNTDSFKEKVMKNLKNRGKKQEEQSKKALQQIDDEERKEEEERLRKENEEEESQFLANQYWRVPDEIDIDDLLKDY